jgi:hypothetical protein
MPSKDNHRINFIPDFDSSSSMLFSLGNYLSRSEASTGLPSKFPKMLGDIVNFTPEALRESIYRLSGIQESLQLNHVRRISDEYISQWIIDAYPERKFPAVMIGSSSGALSHVCASLDIPWIPQTVLLPVARHLDPDELIKDAEWGKKIASIIREKIPYMAVYQMHDPIQDRVMIPHMGYFRIKRRALGPKLESYIKQILMPHGTIYISDCHFLWPAASISEGHSFQTGGLGDVSGNEYARGSERIEKFLEKEGSKQKKWKTPSPLKSMPEAEWGFDEALAENIVQYAQDNQFNVKRIKFDHPEKASPMAADLSRSWYAKNGIASDRLLVECFALLEPWWAAKTGSIPYWMPFNTNSSFQALKEYLRHSSSFNEIYLMLMSNAVEGIGSVSIKQWKQVLNQAQKHGAFIGVNESKFPHDMGSFIKYHKDLQKKICSRNFMPYPLTLDDFHSFMRKKGQGYGIDLITEAEVNAGESS